MRAELTSAQCALAAEDRMVAEFRDALATGRVVGAHCHRCGRIPSVHAETMCCERCGSAVTALIKEVA